MISATRKSGRVGKAGAAIGNFLKIKPIFSIEGGETSVKGFPMGSGGAFDKMLDLMNEAILLEAISKWGLHMPCRQKKTDLVKPRILENYHCVEVYETLIGTSVGTTMGPGSFGYCPFCRVNVNGDVLSRTGNRKAA